MEVWKHLLCFQVSVEFFIKNLDIQSMIGWAEHVKINSNTKSLTKKMTVKFPLQKVGVAGVFFYQ